MISDAVIQALKKFVPEENICLQEPMAGHTTFRIGGPADCFLQPENEEQLIQVQRYLGKVGLPFFVLGNGSNLLVSDAGYRGAIIQVFRNMSGITTEGTKIRASAGALLSAIAAEARNASLTGFEFAAGIPGTLGGAVVMNAGAYGGEMKQVLNQVTVMNREGEILTIPAEKLELGYRTSIVKTAGYFVLEAVILLKEGDQEVIRARMKELQELRTSKQPLEYPSAGSTFKRPEGYFAGKLIMDSGLAGYRVGGAQVSEKHCGFVINTGDATARDVMLLMAHIIKTVQTKYGVTLQPEVKFLGDF